MPISDKIIRYYYQNKRDLAWRNTKDPYIIWISEIMLQQTRVDQATGYFKRFTRRFPDVQSLANASEDEVLKLWQGLGYYSRARNLHFTAKYIAHELNGEFPASYKELLKLKGIGEYTAAAIASIAFNEKVAAIDGNVYRVLARILDEHSPVDTADGKKKFKQLANDLIQNHAPGDFNQAMMEFGATVCKPANPQCADCPVSGNCLALQNGTIMQVPVKKKMQKVKNRYFHYLYIIEGKNTFLQKRPGKDIWKGLYEFPLIETQRQIQTQKLILSDDFRKLFKGNVHIEHISEEIKHRLSHQLLHIRFYKIIAENFFEKDAYTIISVDEIEKYPVPKVIAEYIKESVSEN